MILGLGSYLPEQVLTNDDLAGLMDTSDEWIFSRTGIRSRRRAAPEETTASMGARAARAAMEAAGVGPDDIDAIVFGTMFPEYSYPGPGMMVQQHLGLQRPVPVFDLRQQCAGFVYALSMADLYIAAGQARHVLAVFSEREYDHFKIDRQIGVIFGDGAGAAVIGSARDGRGLLCTDLHGDGAGVADLVMTSDNMPGIGTLANHWPEELARCKAYWDERGFDAGHTKFPFWNGQEVFKNAVKRLMRSTRDVLGAAGIAAADIDRFFFHQANGRINDKLVELLRLPSERVPANIERIGNTGAASIPILMDEEFRAGHLPPGTTCLLSAFGAGYLWGSALLRF
ncbi:MAG TPA: beta-ketoacyl-ACP synthase 3 [Polyangia bacterium]|nr:beta-ketoacyl-ACP synthase 3 [Polyangia bacterium]